MIQGGRYGEDTTRLKFLFAGMVLALLFLGAVLWRLQILQAHRYIGKQRRQSVRRVRVPGNRGRIFDRNGVCLARNRVSFCIAFYLEELRQPGGWSRTVDHVDMQIDKMAESLGISRETTREDIVRHVRLRLPLPFLAWTDLPEDIVAKLEESGTRIAGVDIYVRPVRVYPRGKLAAHVVGYVGKADFSSEAGEVPDYYLPEMEGKRGLERVYNGELAGLPGADLIRIDVSHYRRGILKDLSRHPYPGEDIYTVLDVRIQKLAEQALRRRRNSQELRKGAIVVIDPSNGDILAMASGPSFDPRIFTPSLSVKDWERVRNDSARPMLNRAISGAYPPGSIFKPIVALAALENGDVGSDQRFNCPGYFALGSAVFGCWLKRGHGSIAMRKAIEQSCNAYFCEIGLKTGHRSIVHMAESLGLGRKTGIGLGAERAGLVPDNAWKRRVYGDSWRSGDTCNISIGQGALLVTPLQMAVYTAALANGGVVYRPRLVKRRGRDGEVLNRLSWSRSALEVVRGGMRDVVNADSGTGKRARIEAAVVAGKTGTAQYGRPGQNKQHTWMIAFAPFQDPRYAVAMVIEDGVSGGITVAPRMGKLMDSIFDLELNAGNRG